MLRRASRSAFGAFRGVLHERDRRRDVARRSHGGVLGGRQSGSRGFKLRRGLYQGPKAQMEKDRIPFREGEGEPYFALNVFENVVCRVYIIMEMRLREFCSKAELFYRTAP